MLGTRRQRRDSVAFLLLSLTGAATGIRSLVACSDPYLGEEGLPVQDAATTKDGGGTKLGDAVAAGDAGCAEPVRRRGSLLG